MQSPWVIEVEGLAAGYGDKVILHDVDVRFPRGKVTCIVGGSGSGKSTLLKSLVGLLPPMDGSVRVLGEDLYALDEEERGDLLARVGYMFQYGALLASLTVAENLLIPLRAHTSLPPEIMREIIGLKLAQVGLADARHKLPGELSGGMRKRAGFARAMILDPPVLLCDEPSAGLDPVTMANVDELLLRFRGDSTLVVVTHEVSSIRHIADQVVMLHHGTVHFDGTLDEALASDDDVVRRFFERQAEDQIGGGRSLLEALTAGGAPS